MTEPQSSITQELEHLFEKTSETNRILISESAKFVKQLSTFKLNAADLAPKGRMFIQDALTMYMKLNIQYASNLLDLGMALTKRFNEQFDIKEEGTDLRQSKTGQSSASVSGKPAFELTASGVPGTTISVPFLLDSDKKDAVICNLKQSEFILQNQGLEKFDFKTDFSPQSFQLVAGKAQKVEIIIQIPSNAKEGVYQSNIQVNGF